MLLLLLLILDCCRGKCCTKRGDSTAGVYAVVVVVDDAVSATSAIVKGRILLEVDDGMALSNSVYVNSNTGVKEYREEALASVV